MKTITENLKVEYPASWPLVQAVLGILRAKDAREYLGTRKFTRFDKVAVFYVDEMPVAIWRAEAKGTSSYWTFLSTENVTKVTKDYLKLSKTCYEWISMELEGPQIEEIVILTPAWYPETIRWMDTYVGYLISRETRFGVIESRLKRIRKGES